MAEICCEVMSDQSEGSSVCETTSSRAARKRRMEIRKIKFGVSGHPVADTADNLNFGAKRKRLDVCPEAEFSRECDNAVENSVGGDHHHHPVIQLQGTPVGMNKTLTMVKPAAVESEPFPKFGMASVCGRRRDMEDAVAIRPSFCCGGGDDETSAAAADDVSTGLHYFAVYDGHGCSHVATKCRDRMHVLVKEELEVESREEIGEWKNALQRSFRRMDKEAVTFNTSLIAAANCRCELQSPECDAVGSAAVVALVSQDQIVIANCGDCRAVLCRNGKPIPLSVDHKPDRPDELDRIQAAGGRVISWDCPRVEGVLAMSRAIGDNYLKPYVSCEPEVTITERTAEDDCLILASDGLWDVISNETACGVARMCLKGKVPAGNSAFSVAAGEAESIGNEKSDKACSDASMLLTKLALARRSSDNVSVIVIDLRKEPSVNNF
ncbi:OLC1v1006083C1 [Oldenlandia corymbosa var. corymbosa]|uniref:protein-serine/threonine phosphatase n=1 Tax=Oldenlandia corymbosa var. corymbosa TaxID=529605 RepID=A0AAV1DGH7_OLDCO|nr:OLC1v1006083C1 [Oldenlandia corymbosa var. corymbosa]